MALNPVLSAAAQGVRDPEGCRVAILSYGEILGWPSINVGPLTLRGGEAQWRQSVAIAQPLWLGVAWNQIEKLEHEWQLDREDEQAEKDKEKLLQTIQCIQCRTVKPREEFQPRYPGTDSQARMHICQKCFDQRQAERDKEKTDVAILQWSDMKTLEAGDYPAVITKIEETTGEYGPQFQFQFVVLDAEGEETDDEIRGWCSQKWGEKTKLYKWAKAILGKRCPGAGQPMDTDKLKGRKCDLRIEEKAGQQGGTRSSIAEIYPYQTVSKAETNEESDPPF